MSGGVDDALLVVGVLRGRAVGWLEDGEIVYGEYKKGEALKKARAFVKEHQANADFELLDKEIDKIVKTTKCLSSFILLLEQ